jgi:hypothetical protein
VGQYPPRAPGAEPSSTSNRSDETSQEQQRRRARGLALEVEDVKSGWIPLLSFRAAVVVHPIRCDDWPACSCIHLLEGGTHSSRDSAAAGPADTPPTKSRPGFTCGLLPSEGGAPPLAARGTGESARAAPPPQRSTNGNEPIGSDSDRIQPEGSAAIFSVVAVAGCRAFASFSPPSVCSCVRACVRACCGKRAPTSIHREPQGVLLCRRRERRCPSASAISCDGEPQPRRQGNKELLVVVVSARRS